MTRRNVTRASRSHYRLPPAHSGRCPVDRGNETWPTLIRTSRPAATPRSIIDAAPPRARGRARDVDRLARRARSSPHSRPGPLTPERTRNPGAASVAVLSSAKIADASARPTSGQTIPRGRGQYDLALSADAVGISVRMPRLSRFLKHQVTRVSRTVQSESAVQCHQSLRLSKASSTESVTAPSVALPFAG